MSGIEFHCPQCDKLIKAPAASGGKHGKCPACGRNVYIPTPPEELDPYDMAPLDEQEERLQRRLQEESYQTERERLLGSTGPDEDGAAEGGSGVSRPPEAAEDPRKLVIAYLQAMIDSRLDEADGLIERMRAQKKAIKRAIEQLAANSIPPEELSTIPEPLLHGFLKSLNGRL